MELLEPTVTVGCSMVPVFNGWVTSHGQLIVGTHFTPLVLGFAFVALTAVRSLWLRRSAGLNAYVINHRDPMHRFIGGVFFAVVVGLIVYFSALALWPELEERLGRLAWASGEGGRSIGVAVMACADRAVRAFAQSDLPRDARACSRA